MKGCSGSSSSSPGSKKSTLHTKKPAAAEGGNKGKNAKKRKKSSDGENGDDINSIGDKNIVLSLRDDKYHEKIEDAWKILWCKSKQGDDVSNKEDLAQELYADLNADLTLTGGSLYRLTKGGSHEASKEEALQSELSCFVLIPFRLNVFSHSSSKLHSTLQK